MPVVLDTSILVAFLNARDRNHSRSVTLMDRIRRGEYGVPVASDYVLDEGLTLLQKRTRDATACREYEALFFGEGSSQPLLSLRETSSEELAAARDIFFRHFERGLSFTDCVIVALAESLRAPVASLDAGFDGIVPRVPLDGD